VNIFRDFDHRGNEPGCETLILDKKMNNIGDLNE